MICQNTYRPNRQLDYLQTVAFYTEPKRLRLMRVTFKLTWIDLAVREELAYGIPSPEVNSFTLPATENQSSFCAIYTARSYKKLNSKIYLSDYTKWPTLEQTYWCNSQKANNTRAFLQRNIKHCPGKTKELCYKTLVCPILEYASVIWDPFTDDNILKLEIVQRRAAHMVPSYYRFTSSATPILYSSSDPPFRSAEPRQSCTWCITLSTA